MPKAPVSGCLATIDQVIPEECPALKRFAGLEPATSRRTEQRRVRIAAPAAAVAEPDTRGAR
jgi:hypothetical protein